MPRVREEVLNVLMAELLSQRGLLSIPEIIRRSLRGSGRRLPDVTIGDIRGVRVVIEGRVDASSDVRESLIEDAARRVEEGIAPICLAILYPPSVRSAASLSELRKNLANAQLMINVVWEGGRGDWAGGSLDDVTDILRRSYELLAGEDVVAVAASDLNEAIEVASESIAAAGGLPAKLRALLGIPEETGGTLDDEEDAEE